MFNVEVPVFVTAIGFDVKLPLAFAGRPLTLKFTTLEIPDVPVAVIVKLSEALAITVRDFGEFVIEKLKIFNVTIFVCTMLPLVPRLVNEYTPGTTEFEAIMLNTELPLPLVIEAAVKNARTPAGIPLTVRS